MTIEKSRRFRIRNEHGASGLAEFGPALGLLVICFFFPMVDLLSTGVSYGLCMVLNSNQAHEASLLNWQDATDPAGAVQKDIPEQWMDGMGHFVKIVGIPQTVVNYRPGQTGEDNVTDQIVSVQTTVVCSPFLPIPLPLVNVPGLNGPMTFAINSERQMENPDYAKP